jgi:TATA-binding protein-associated factor Taf7
MDWEILAYLGAPLMVVLAFVAYRYWNSTASYALRMRESHARRPELPADASADPVEGASVEDVDAEDADSATAEQEEQEEAVPNGTPETASEHHAQQPEGESDGPEEAEDPPGDELKPDDSGQIGQATDSIAALIRTLDEQLAALPSGIELIDLPILERRRIADRRDELLSDRERVLAQKKRGAHRYRRRSRARNR